MNFYTLLMCAGWRLSTHSLSILLLVLYLALSVRSKSDVVRGLTRLVWLTLSLVRLLFQPTPSRAHYVFGAPLAGCCCRFGSTIDSRRRASRVWRCSSLHCGFLLLLLLLLSVLSVLLVSIEQLNGNYVISTTLQSTNRMQRCPCSDKTGAVVCLIRVPT